MTAKLHYSTYTEVGRAFTMDVSWYDGDVFVKRGPHRRDKPSISPTKAELLALFQETYPQFAVEWVSE